MIYLKTFEYYNVVIEDEDILDHIDDCIAYYNIDKVTSQYVSKDLVQAADFKSEEIDIEMYSAYTEEGFEEDKYEKNQELFINRVKSFNLHCIVFYQKEYKYINFAFFREEDWKKLDFGYIEIEVVFSGEHKILDKI